MKFLYTIPSATFSLQKTLTDSEILANPKIRVKNKEKAKVHIGSREPIVTTTTSANDVTSANVQYVDVGVKLDVEPTIQLDNTVVTKLSLEVSSVSGRKPITGGGEALTISTTNAQTSLVLRDGEQTIIGGLIRDDFTSGKTAIPFFGDLPFVGALISGHKRDKTKREIVLSITPHIVKNIEMPRPEVSTIWSGGEDDLEAGARFGSFAKPLEPVTMMTLPAVAPARLGALAAPKSSATETSHPVSVPASTVPAEEGAPDAGMPAMAPPVEKETLMPGRATVGITVPDLAVTQATIAPLPIAGPIPSNNPETTSSKIELVAPKNAAIGEEVTVLVNVQNVQELYSAPLFVNYDSQQFEFVRADESEFPQGQRPIDHFYHQCRCQKGPIDRRLQAGDRRRKESPAQGHSSNWCCAPRQVVPVALASIGSTSVHPQGLRLPMEDAETIVEVH